MKALIALAAAAACVALGGISARRLALREEETRRWDRALMTLEGELEGGGLPLPQLMEKAGVDTLKTGAQLLRDARLPVISRGADGRNLSVPAQKIFEADCRAADIWALGLPEKSTRTAGHLMRLSAVYEA